MALSPATCMNRFCGFVKTLKEYRFSPSKILSATFKRASQQAGLRFGGSESDVTDRPAHMELELLDKKLRRLVCKLRKHDIFLEVFDHSDLQYGDMLGRGGEAEVRKCTVVYNDVPVEAAVKTVINNSEDAISITLDEIELLCLARDPIINTTLQVYGVAAVPDDDDPEMGHLVIVTEAGRMNALQLYQQESVPLSVTLDLWKRLAAALYTIHNRRIIHQDLKPENILVTAINRDRSGNIEKIDFKIIDLGMGKRVYTEKVVTDDILGTNGYHAPEVLFEDSYDFKADIFMLGITFCVLLHSSEFLKGKSNLSRLLNDIHNGKERQLTGRDLFEEVIVPTFDDYQNMPVTVINTICQMLEKQELRTITLLDVIQVCGQESSRQSRLQRSGATPPVLQAWCGQTGPDSGISSAEGESKTYRRPRRTAVKRSGSTASSPITISDVSSRRTYRTRSSTSSAVSSIASSATSTTTNNSHNKRVKKAALQKELDSLFEPWMGDMLGNRRSTKRLRSDTTMGDTGHDLRKREKRETGHELRQRER